MLSLVLLVCVLCLVWSKNVRVKRSTHALPPAVPGKWPIIGHTYTLFKYSKDLQELLKYASADCARQGGLTHFNFGSELYYLIVDPLDAFTAANVCLTKHYVFDLGKVWVGDGLVTSSGDIWKHHRKLLTPAFTLPVVLGFLDVFNSQAKKLTSSMEPHVGKGRFDQYPYMQNNALETLCVGTFGIDVIDDVKFTQKYMESVYEMVNIGINRAIHFWLLNDFIYRLVGLKKKEEDVVATLHAMTIKVRDIWKHHRKLLTPAFTLPVVLGFLDVFNSQAKKLTSSMEPHVGKGRFDQYPYMQNNALETLCVGTFGIDVIDDVKFTQKYMESVYEMVNIGINRAIHFWLLNDFIYRLVGLKKKEEDVVATLHAMTIKVLQNKKATMKKEALNNSLQSENSGNKYKPFLDLLLDLSKNGALTDQEIREQMDTIIAVGFETTSNQLTYTLLQLGAHPEVQEKLHKEILEVLGADRDVGKDDVNKLVYTNAVIMESLRTLPSVPVLIRVVDEDVELKNYTMRAGSYCIIFPLATHFDTSWGAERDQFRPERWLDGDFIHNKEFAAFGLGKRACIGRTYAMISMKVTLAHFVRQYRVTADMSKLKMKYELAMRPVSGHEISIERRT